MALPRISWLRIWPRRLLMSPITPPTKSPGVTTSTSMIGSSSFTPAFAQPSRIAEREAISKAMALESTSWKAPSYSVTFMSTIGKPISTPASHTLCTPFSTPGMYSFGTTPPTISLSNSLPLPVSLGSSRSLTRANWPVPPVCFLCV